MRSLLITLIFSMIATSIFGQDKNIKNGIFDIDGTATAICSATLIEADGIGESVYYTKKLPNGNLKVRYIYNKPSVPNPLFITYAYGIAKLPSGDFVMDMQAAMPPLSLYIDTAATELSYTGDKIILPNTPSQDSLLSDATGIFQLKMLKDNRLLVSYEVSLTNRKITKQEDITLHGQTYEVYLHSYDFLQKTIINQDQVLATIQETVTEWLIPNYGQVAQNRTGTQVTTTTTRQLTSESNLQSTLLNLKN